MRTNPELATHQHPYKTDDSPTGDQRKFLNAGRLGKGNYAAPRHPLAAAPLITNQLKNPATYSTGDGDSFHQPQRPGSDHSHIKSKGHQC
jgi:hypothetical protein